MVEEEQVPHTILLRQTKGGRPRYAMLSGTVSKLMSKHLVFCRSTGCYHAEKRDGVQSQAVDFGCPTGMELMDIMDAFRNVKKSFQTARAALP